jgi:hypothetical protein
MSSALVLGLTVHVQVSNSVDANIAKDQINNNNTVVSKNESYNILNDSKLQVQLASFGPKNATQIAFSIAHMR